MLHLLQFLIYFPYKILVPSHKKVYPKIYPMLMASLNTTIVFSSSFFACHTTRKKRRRKFHATVGRVPTLTSSALLISDSNYLDCLTILKNNQLIGLLTGDLFEQLSLHSKQIN